MPWREFLHTHKGKQLSANTDVTSILKRFVNDLPECRSPQEKVILIDSLIHACHENIIKGTRYYGRPLAVNLIKGTRDQVIAFLESLPYGPSSLPEMSEHLMEWRKRCLSLQTGFEVEMDLVSYLVDTMPSDLKNEIEEMIAQNRKLEAAVTRLREIGDYAKKLKFLRGTVARQMVLTIKRRMKR